MRLQVIDIQKHDVIDPASGLARPSSAFLQLESLAGARIEVRHVTVEELRMAQRLHGSNIGAINANTSLPEEQRQRLIATLGGGDGRPREAGAQALTSNPVRPQTSHAKLAFQEIDLLASLTDSALLPKPGGFFDVALSTGLEASIKAADEARFKIVVANDPISMGNQVAGAMARVGLFIDELVAKAKIQMYATRPPTQPVKRTGQWLHC